MSKEINLNFEQVSEKDFINYMFNFFDNKYKETIAKNEIEKTMQNIKNKKFYREDLMDTYTSARELIFRQLEIINPDENIMKKLNEVGSQEELINILCGFYMIINKINLYEHEDRSEWYIGYNGMCSELEDLQKIFIDKFMKIELNANHTKKIYYIKKIKSYPEVISGAWTIKTKFFYNENDFFNGTNIKR